MTFFTTSFFLDIEPYFNIEESQYIASIAELIKKLLSKKINAVPACDFEDELRF